MSKAGDTMYFTIKGRPVPQGRPRARAMGKHATVYEDKKSKDAKANIVAHLHEMAHASRQSEPFFDRGVPLEVNIEFYFEIPKSRKKSTVAGDAHLIKPDIDNLAKLVLDAVTKAGTVWYDDNQISYLNLTKRYGVEAKTTIYVEHSV